MIPDKGTAHGSLGEWVRRMPRRVATTSIVIVGSVLYVLLTPVLLIVAVVLDVMTDWQDRRYLRILAFVGLLLLNELFGITTLLVFWVLTGFGIWMHTGISYAAHGWLHGRWTRNILWSTQRCFRTTITVEGAEVLEPAPVVVLSRHISLLDAVIPSVLLTRTRWHAPRHVFMQELRFDPCIDTLGHRTPNHLVDRQTGGPAELAAIAAVGATLDERGSGVIFPEGGFRTDARFERAMKSLSAKAPALAEKAGHYRNIMPPRAGGAHALLSAAPHADVVILAHRGFDGVSTVADILRGPQIPQIDVRVQRVPRSEVPAAADEFADWLFDRFAEIDDWIEGLSPVVDLRQPPARLPRSQMRANSDGDVSV